MFLQMDVLPKMMVTVKQEHVRHSYSAQRRHLSPSHVSIDHTCEVLAANLKHNTHHSTVLTTTRVKHRDNRDEMGITAYNYIQEFQVSW